MRYWNSSRLILAVAAAAVLAGGAAIVNSQQIADKGELFDAFSAHQAAVTAGRWSEAADGLSNAFLGGRARQLIVNAPEILAIDSKKDAAGVIGDLIGKVALLCDHSESRAPFSAEVGELKVVAWVRHETGYFRLRGVYSYIRADGVWQIDRSHIYVETETQPEVGSCPEDPRP